MHKTKAKTKYHAKKAENLTQLHFPRQKDKFCAEKVKL
jgi:hypothetical protein